MSFLRHGGCGIEGKDASRPLPAPSSDPRHGRHGHPRLVLARSQCCFAISQHSRTGITTEGGYGKFQAIDRLVHHVTILEMNIESYRRKVALKRKRGKADLTVMAAQTL